MQQRCKVEDSANDDVDLNANPTNVDEIHGDDQDFSPDDQMVTPSGDDQSSCSRIRILDAEIDELHARMAIIKSAICSKTLDYSQDEIHASKPAHVK